MKAKTGVLLFIVLAVGLVAASCGPTPEPQVVEKTVKETVVVEQTVKETVIVEGSPQVVEKVVTATPETAEAAAAGAPKTFTVSWVSADMQSFDPHACVSSECLNLVRNIYESLVGYEYGGTEIEPQLAESWEVSDDGLQWTFTLREGLVFADGSPITPEDVVYSLDRIKGMETGTAVYLGGVYEEAEIVDDKTVTIKLEKAIGPFLAMLPRVFIVNSEVVKANATADDPWAEKWMYDHDAGSGPFMFEAWEHGVKASIVRNPNYWDPSRPKSAERMTVLLIPERATDQMLLERGEIDAIGFPAIDLIPIFEANPDLTVGKHDSFKGMNIQMNPTVPPLDDVRVRKAIALAFDYQAEVDGVFSGLAVQAQGPLPRSMKYHDDTLPIYKQDVDQAKALLAEAGYPDGGGLEMELVCITGYTPWINTAQVLQQSLAQVGIKLNIVEMEHTQMVARGHSTTDPLQIFVFNSFPSYEDPDALFYTMYHTSQWDVGWNIMHYGDAETDALIDKGRYSIEEAEREAAYKELQRRMVEEYAAIWMVNEQVLSVRRSWVEDYKYDPLWHETFRPDMVDLSAKP